MVISTFETVLERVKEGPFQYLLFFSCSSWGFFGGMQVILAAFLVPAQVQFECHIPELNGTGWTPEQQKNFSLPILDGIQSHCVQYKRNYSSFLDMSFDEAFLASQMEGLPLPEEEPCSHWKYDQSIFTRTLISDYDLVCDKFYLRSFVQGAFMLGVLVASPVGGVWADTSGRLPVIWVSLVGFLAIGLLICFVNNFMAFLIARFIVGFFGHCLYQTSYILVVEWSLTKRRSVFGIIFSLPFALGYMLLPIIAHFNRDYRVLLLALGCFAFCLIVSVLIMTESPRWSIQHGKTSQAVKAVDKACRLNSQTPIEKAWLLETFASIKKEPEQAKIVEPKKENSEGCCKGLQLKGKNHPLFVSRKLQKYTAILTTNWIISTMVYYGLALNSGSFNFDPFLYIFLSGVMELPAYTVIVPIVAKYGRKAPVVITYMLCGVCLIVALCLPKDITFWVSLGFNMAGKLCITCAFQILFLYTSEIFPTCVRTQGVGITMMVGRLGAIAAPFIIDNLGLKFWALPNIIFGGASIFAALLTFLLPETYKQSLPDTTDDVENWSDNSKGNLYTFQEGNSEVTTTTAFNEEVTDLCREGSKMDIGLENTIEELKSSKLLNVNTS